MAIPKTIVCQLLKKLSDEQILRNIKSTKADSRTGYNSEQVNRMN